MATRSFVADCRALSVVFDQGMAFSGSTAARVWGLPLPLGVEGVPFRVSSLRPTRALRRKSVIGTERGTGSPVHHDGIPVLDPVATWLSLGRELKIPDLTAVADRLISGTLRSRPLASRDQLERAVEDFRGTGCALLRSSLTLSRSPVWSRPETLLRLLIREAGLPEPTPNLEVFDGVDRCYIDLTWPEWMVGIEYQGRWHDETPEQRERDARRRETLVDLGWTLVEVRSADLFDAPHALAGRLMQRLSAAGWVGSSRDLTHLPRYRR